MANKRKYPIPEIGHQFNDWTVVDNKLRQCPTIKQKVKGVVVECKCGNDAILPPSYLYRGKSQRCQRCKGDRLSALKFKGVGELSSSYFTQIKRNAKHRNLTFNVPIQYLWDLFIQQEQKCALSGVEITLSKSYANKIRKGRTKGRAIYETASVDRINSNKGYEKGNVQWVHKTVNLMKNNLNQQLFIDFCNQITKQHTTPRIEILTRVKVEGVHRWKKCPIKEVSYLKKYHRHTFHIIASNYGTHADRDVEFIEFGHQILAYLNTHYYNTHYDCLFFDDCSCEMIAEELVEHFNLAWCEVNEDGEGGSIVRNI